MRSNKKIDLNRITIKLNSFQDPRLNIIFIKILIKDVELPTKILDHLIKGKFII